MTQTETTAAPGGAQTTAQALVPALKPEQVLKPIGSTPHFQDHASVKVGGTDVSVYSCVGPGEGFEDAGVYLILNEGNFHCSVDLPMSAARELQLGFEKAIHTVGVIHSLGKVVEVPATEDWVHYEQVSPSFVDAKFGGISFRVFASQLEHQAAPEVQLCMYSQQGFVAGSMMLPGFLSPDAADELADSLKAAAYKARMLAAQQIAEGA